MSVKPGGTAGVDPVPAQTGAGFCFLPLNLEEENV